MNEPDPTVLTRMRANPAGVRFRQLHAVCKFFFGEPRRRSNTDHYTCRITWSEEDRQNVGLCAEFPSLSWLADTPGKALRGIRKVVADVLADWQSSGEEISVSPADRHHSGEFRIPIPPDLHRALVIEAAEQGGSLNRLTSAKLAG